MPTSQQLKERQDLARKRAKKATPDLAKLSIEQKRRQQVTWDPLATWSLAWKTVTPTWFAEKIWADAMKEQQRVFAKRQACEAKGWTFNTVTEKCSMWITEELWVSESFRWQRVSKEQEALNLIARWDVEQVAEWDISWLSETALATLAWAKKQEEEKTELEKKLEKAKVDARKKLELKQKAIESAAPWVVRWAEAPTLALARWIEWIQTKRAAIIEEEFAVNQQAISDAQTELDEALRTWRVDLVKQARWAMLDLRKQELNLKTQATTDVIETLWDTLLGKSEEELQQIALDQNVDLWLLKLQQEKLELKDATAEQAAQIASTKTSQTNIKTLAENWGILAYNTDQLLELDKSAGYAPWTSALIAQRAREVQEADKADKALAEEKMKAEIDGINAKTKTELWKDKPEQAFSFVNDTEMVTELESLPEWTNETGLPRQWSEEARWECWAFVNDVLWQNIVQDSYASKINESNWAKVWMEEIAKPYPWAAFVYQGKDPNSTEFWHIWFVTWVNKDWTYEVTDSNVDWNRATQHRSSVDLDKMKWIKFFGKSELKEVDLDNISDSEIALFNWTKYNPQTDKNKQRVAKFNTYINAVAKLQSNKDADPLDLMRVSRWQKPIAESPNKVYKDLWTVVNQLTALSDSIDNYRDEQWFSDEFSPIEWAIRSVSPWSTKAQWVKAQLKALVPKLARWVFWEVWVLTDTDIANYIETLPNIKQTADVQDIVQLALLWTLQSSMDNAIVNDAWIYNIAPKIWPYKKLQEKIEALRANIEDTTPAEEDVEWQVPSTLDSTSARAKYNY